MDYKELIAGNISEITGLEKEKVTELIEIPPRLDMGDFAFPCFTLAKTLHKAPPLIANELAANAAITKGAEEELKAAAAGPYLNFKLDRKVLAKELITEIREASDSFGAAKLGEGKNVIVEFSSPNIAKPFHVGHAFTTILGDSISNIYSKLGYNVIRFNHLGDYGTQFGKLITAWRLWGDEKAMETDAIEELTRIYVKFHQEAKNDETLEDTARDNFRKLEEGSEEEVALWKMFRDLSLEVFEKTYSRLGVKFDNYNGESFYSSRIPAVVDLLREKGLLEESEGAQVVKFDEEGMPPCMILKSDGTTIYASRDLAAAIYRHDEYNFYRNIYVVGLPQQLHFRQVFGVLKKAGFDWAAPLRRRLEETTRAVRAIEQSFLQRGVVSDTDRADREFVGARSSYTFSKNAPGAKLKLNVAPAPPAAPATFQVGPIGRFAQDSSLPEGVVYQIQVFTSPRHATLDEIKGLDPVYERLTNTLRYTYSVGVFRTYNEALLQLNPVRVLGFPSAEIVAYLDGKPVAVSLARRLETTPAP